MRSFHWLTAGCLAVIAGAWCVAAPPTPAIKHVAIVTGYPAPDTSMYEFAFRQRLAKPVVFDKQWLPVDEYTKYAVVVLHGNIARAKVEPAMYAAADFPMLKKYLDDGGVLLLTSTGLDAFHTPEGRKFLESVIGKAPAGKQDKAPSTVLMPNHPWVKQLAGQDIAWLSELASPIASDKGEQILGTGDGRTILGQYAVGKGQVIYVGWCFSAFMPSGRDLKSTLEQEKRYEDQYQILANIAASLASARE